MIDFSWPTIVWIALTALVGAFMWAARVSPDQAKSNLAAWTSKYGGRLNFLTSPRVAPHVRLTAAIAFGCLLFIGGMLAETKLRLLQESSTALTNRRTIAEIALKLDGTKFVRDVSVPQLSVDRWETFSDGTMRIQFANQAQPATISVRIAGQTDGLTVLERGQHTVRFKLPSGTTQIHLVIEASQS